MNVVQKEISCIPLVSVSWCNCKVSVIVQSPGLFGKFHLHCLLGKENQLFTFIGKFRYL